jgi:plasmid stability protein
MPDQVYNIIAKVQNEALVKQLSEALRVQEELIRNNIAVWGAHDQATRTAGQQHVVLAGQLKQAQHELATIAAQSGTASQKMIQFTYALDDAQQFGVSFVAGMRSISNNLPALIALLGGPAGLALGVTAAGIAVSQLAQHWDQLKAAFIGGETRSQAQQMDELAKATSRTADEEERLLKFRKQRAAIEEQRSARSEEEQAAGKAVGQAVAEAPGGQKALVEALVDARNPNGLEGRITPEDQAHLTKRQAEIGFYKSIGFDTSRDERETEHFKDEAINRARDVERHRAEEALADAQNTPEGRQRLLNETGRAPEGSALNRFGRDIKARVFLGSPEGKDQQETTDEDQKESDKILARQKAARKKAAEDAKKKAQQEQERRDAELAKNLGPSLELDALTGGKVDRNRVKQALVTSQGLDPATAERSADAVLKNLNDNFQERLRTRAGQKGISIKAAGEDILFEDLAKGAEAGKDEAEKARKAKEAALKDKVDSAKESGAEVLAKAAASSGGSSTRIRDLLIARGIDPDAATFLGKEAFQGEQKSRLQDALTPEKPRNSEVFGAEGLASAIQRSVGGGDTADKQLRVQERQLDALNSLIRQGRAVPVGGPPPTRSRRA